MKGSNTFVMSCRQKISLTQGLAGFFKGYSPCIMNFLSPLDSAHFSYPVGMGIREESFFSQWEK